jgi:glyoxylase-like metal-dependent hydrolase (beta-lactamase superfamily II)/8-oxo-dGTP pyrophosphatase MutT (NUDIX family)
VPNLIAAASVLLSRGPDSSELFFVRRSEKLRFFGGFHAFPGGKLHPDDFAVGSDGVARQRSAAVRELFEETGVLLARHADGRSPVDGVDLAAARRDLLTGTLRWPDLLKARQLRVDPADLVYAGSLQTPAFSQVRFDTAFFVASLPAGQSAEVWPGELSDGFWSTPAAVLDGWKRGELHPSPPTVSLSELLVDHAVADLPMRLQPMLARLADGALPTIAFSPGVFLLPLASAALPPSSHTNAYLIGQPAFLIDPGPDDPAEQRRLFGAIDEHTKAGRSLAGILLTHHHPDHVGAAAACAERYRVPVFAHRLTADRLTGRVTVDRLLEDGKRLPLGPAADGSGPLELEAVFTPGHAPGHLAFYEPRYGLLFVGDMISTLSSVVISPPEGDLAEYLASLHRLRTYPARLLLPGHGPPNLRPAHALDEAIEHRRLREEQLVQALTSTPRGVHDLTIEVYRGLPAHLMPFAEMQVRAGLLKLQSEGRANAEGDSWRGR